jgi:penicillin amidase
MGYMAFSFAEALKTDPILNNILHRYGTEHLNAISESNVDTTDVLPAATLFSIFERSPAAPFIGSNAWAVAPAKSVSGKPLFANDTHIGYAQPCVWYEAYLEYPGITIYGNFLAGFPYPLIGHTRHHSWGMTMLENDDMDFFIEKLSSDNTSFLSDKEWIPLTLRKEIIKRKDAADTTIIVRSTRNGPLMNEVMDILDSVKTPAVSLWWLFTQFENTALQAARQMMQATSVETMRQACQTLISPGLNIIYADTSGNIAHWVAGKMLKRKTPSHSKIFRDGSKTENTVAEYFPFEDNPQEVNPERGFVFSANRIPDSLLHLHPGYYAPPDRSLRIEKLLSLKNRFDKEDMKRIQLDNLNEIYASIANRLAAELKSLQHSDIRNGELFIETLEQWKGEHELNSRGPVVFYKLISELLDRTLADELDSLSYATIKTSHHLKNIYSKIFFSEHSPWWDDQRTPDKKETRNDILTAAFRASVTALENQLGPNPENWTWNRVHSITHMHAIGRQPPLGYLFNVGPFPAPGGNETINCSGFPVSSSGNYKVMYGPAMRIVIDLAMINDAESILPTGQSGHFMSRHYDDQAVMYLNGNYRKMIFNMNDPSLRRKLLLNPASKK